MLRVAIVGCGKIADAHVSAIKRIPNCRVVGVCDSEELMAEQLRQRFNIERAFCDLICLLKECRPDVVHITTPPQSHFVIASQCLEAGCHIYVEKPFTLSTAEAEELVALAKKNGLRLTAGHDEQFSHAMRRMRELVKAGYLGGPPVHIESTWCYQLGDRANLTPVIGDPKHWVHKLPGGLVHNLVSHGIAKIAEYLAGDSAEVLTVSFGSQFFEHLNENGAVDELRVIIKDERRTTAYFTFSTQIRPILHQFRLFGPKNALIVDEDQQTLIKVRGERYKSYAENFVPPITFAGQYLQNMIHNSRLFLANDFHMDSSKKYLIEAFYRSIAEAGPVPIPYREILLTSRIMDTIFEKRPLKFTVASEPPTSAVVLAAS
jgi:predicted dehydrogenase